QSRTVLEQRWSAGHLTEMITDREPLEDRHIDDLHHAPGRSVEHATCGEDTPTEHCSARKLPGDPVDRAHDLVTSGRRVERDGTAGPEPPGRVDLSSGTGTRSSDRPVRNHPDGSIRAPCTRPGNSSSARNEPCRDAGGSNARTRPDIAPQ